MKTSFFLCLMLIGSASVFTQQKQTRALIISGGGPRASWASGFAKGLVESGNEYHIVGGTSAGSLITSSVILQQFDKLEQLFNRLNNNDIYSINPIRSNGDIKILKSAWRTLFGYTSIGETKNLRKLLSKIFTKEDYHKILEEKKEIFCVVTSLNSIKRVVKSIKKNSYNDMLDWIWASASVPILTAPVEKDGETWVDGGLTDNIPIDGALNKGADIIDVIILDTKEVMPITSTPQNIPQILGRTINVLTTSVARLNLLAGQLMGELKEGTTMNIYYMPEKDAQLLSNLFTFETKLLSEGFKRGYEAYKNQSMSKKTFIMKNDKKFYEQK